MKIYTRKGDDGTTGLLYGGRVPKDSAQPPRTARSTKRRPRSGLARPSDRAGQELDEILIGLERDLWVLMAELATAPSKHDRLTPGQSLLVTDRDGRRPRAADRLGHARVSSRRPSSLCPARPHGRR